MLLVLIIIAVMLMTATTALATRYFNVESVDEGDLNLDGSCLFHLHGKRTCFDGPDLTLTILHEDLIELLLEEEEEETRTGNTFLYRSKDGVYYGFEWRMYKDKEDCVIHLKSIGNFGVAVNDPTQDDYVSGKSFTVTFTDVDFELVELVSSEKKHPNKPDKTIGPSEWEQVWKGKPTFTIELLEE